MFLLNNKIKLPKARSYISQILIGSIGAIIDLIFFSILSNFFHLYISFLLSIFLAIAINYYLTIRHTFQSKSLYKSLKTEKVLFFTSYIIVIIFQALIIILLTNLQYNLMLSKFIAICFGFVISFYFKWFFIFGTKSEFN
jgi:putative flippase GtrA